MLCSVACGALVYHFDPVPVFTCREAITGAQSPALFVDGGVLVARDSQPVGLQRGYQGCHKRKLLCQRPIGPRQNNIVIGRDQEASERKMCKKNIVDQFRLVYRVRCLLPLKQIL
jgi:hypothetical protein